VLLFNEALTSRTINPSDFKLKLAGKSIRALAATVNGDERRVVVVVDNIIGSSGNLQWRFKSKSRTGGISDQAANPWISKAWRTVSLVATSITPAPAKLEGTLPNSAASSTSMVLGKPGKTQKLAGGLKRRLLTTASTGRPLQEGDLIGVIYTGRLTNGVQFDSNVDSAAVSGDLFTFRLGAGSVIPGFEQGLIDVPLGSTVQLTIPASLAYGSTGAGERIPPNSTLVFDIQVLAMLPKAGGGQINASWSRDYGFDLSTSPIPAGFASALTTPRLGSDRSDTITGSIGNDAILGLSGNDQLSGLAGDDLIIGGFGKNSVSFSGPRADYQITASDRKGTFLNVVDLVPGRDGTDWLTNISMLNFSDGAVKLTALLKSSSSIIG
jgi:FKBP-type peptidyl-prolyl cis-trans isomerase